MSTEPNAAETAPPQAPTEEPSPPPSTSSECTNGGVALSRRKQKKASKVTQRIRVMNGSVDVQVQQTNDDSVVSKRSAVTQGYIRDKFLRHFVKKPSRRSPLINRGYYLRMAIMTDLVVRLVKSYLDAPERQTEVLEGAPCPPPVQVLSLGAGYDTLAFRLLLDSVDVLAVGDKCAGASASSSSSSLSPSAPVSFPGGEVLFIDVDFPAVLMAKAALMAAAPSQTFPEDWHLRPQSADCPIRSPHYSAVGVDLRFASTELLPRLHQHGPTGFVATNPTIIYAECVMQYMPPKDAAQLLALLAAGLPNAVFIAYDQVSPLDSFGRVMQNTLRQKNSPLLGVQSCPDGAHMVRRACAAGMCRAWWADFYRISTFCFAGEERRRVEALEDFDELEEWSEMCEHYGITLATTPLVWDSVATNGCAAHPAFMEYSVDGVACITGVESLPQGTEAIKGTLHNWPSARYGFEGWGNGGVAVEPLSNGDRLLVSFGGFAAGKQHQRVNTVYVHSLQEGELRVVVAGEQSDGAATAGLTACTTHPPPLVFHTFSRVAPRTFLVWGGRSNPSAPSNEAFLLTLDVPDMVSLGSIVTARWRVLRVGSDDRHRCRPSPRYRHSMVNLGGTADKATLLLVGGKTSGVNAAVALECFRVTVCMRRFTISYEALDCTAAGGHLPPPLHSAAAIALSSDAVLISGGVLLGRDACNPHLWQLRLSTKEWSCVPMRLGEGRYAHSLTPVTVNRQEYLLILGGSSWAEKSHVPPALLVPFSLFESNTGSETAAAVAVPVSLPADAPWWSRHSCVTLGQGVVGVIGGGYTCFSFGTFAAKPQLLFLGDIVEESAWRPRFPSACSSNVGRGDGRRTVTALEPVYSYEELLSKPWPAVREVMHYSAAAFLEAATAATQPVVFRNVPLGACLSTWGSSAYLKETEGNTTVSVHVAEKSQLLDFARKNFSFRRVTLAQLVQHTEEATDLFCKTRGTPSETWYYRSIASRMKNERSNVWTDFPVLGKDFVLPPGAKEYIEPRLHQSCLRMSAPPLQLWTHYDTLDNVLCQIVGTKRVVLFPPSEYNNLYVTGSSSAVINLEAPDLVRYPRFIEACRAAQQVILRPGDVLFFPAMWFHHVTTLLPDVEPVESAAATMLAPYNMSVNVFYRHFSDTAAYDAKDLYGNKDILAVTRIREDLQSAVRCVLTNPRLTTAADAPVLPPNYVEFAVRHFLQDLEGTASAVADAQRGTGTCFDTQTPASHSLPKKRE
ncbi:Leucine carboxyl methyltransferase [Leishmania braziliensis]|nr:Leucine carboxyl methyltransferase [Leishmania braziliensis]